MVGESYVSMIQIHFVAIIIVCISLFVFIAPEMLKGDVVGPPADIWSVGVLTFIM